MLCHIWGKNLSMSIRCLIQLLFLNLQKIRKAIMNMYKSFQTLLLNTQTVKTVLWAQTCCAELGEYTWVSICWDNGDACDPSNGSCKNNQEGIPEHVQNLPKIPHLLKSSQQLDNKSHKSPSDSVKLFWLDNRRTCFDISSGRVLVYCHFWLWLWSNRMLEYMQS